MDLGFLALAFGLLFIGGCSARVVTVSPGPLIRVEGQPVSIRCDVNDYEGPSEQDFEWEMSRDAKGPKIKMVSTFDSSFSDPSLSKRVASGDISVVRLQDNEAELKIAEVKSQDSGFYLCRTTSTDSVISGNYEAQVQLKVIPKTLKVSPQTPPPVVLEGNDLTLSCNVTQELNYPTYLSVTWLVKRGTTSEEILTFGPQGDVVTGSKFTRRYLDGGLRLVPGRNGLFELVISRVTTSDQGTYECNGTEWTHESGGKWTKIVESTKEMGTVTVTPTGHFLNVKASSSSSSSPSVLLSPGNMLTLFCYVFADNLPVLSLEMTWLADGREIITMDHSGLVISNTSSNGAQAKRGQATLERTGGGEYRLGVRGVSGEDGGIYTCRVRAFIEKGGRSTGGGGRWHLAAEKMSNPVTVKVSETSKYHIFTAVNDMGKEMMSTSTPMDVF
ncbi:hypothetical protein ATANTOWER_024942 [Ataeniobius toweri]|uniref:Ig-like domain-containing protein n=1 Tax=Ataeniobius toweri TaxID=208326 RepID=A0ABU7A3K9_9TELE|nr:hypothetical protein [Ataeniobius toweri]